VTPTTIAVVLVLGSAVMHAGWNLLLKIAGDKLVTMWTIRLGTLAIAIPFILADPPIRAALPYILISGVLHAAYDLSLVRAYHLGDYSLVYTFARGISPALAAAIALVLLGETLTALAVAGLFTTVTGLLLGTGSLPKLVHDARRALGWSLVTAFFIASYTVLDAAGIRTAGQATSYVGAVFIVNFVLLTPVTLWRRWGHPDWRIIRHQWRGTVTAAPLQIVSYMLVVYALEISAVGYISSLRETGVVIAAVLGWRFLDEPYGRIRVLGTCAVVAGILGMSFSGSV
jgi:drug/metabolite transporter (DMT)-like permease